MGRTRVTSSAFRAPVCVARVARARARAAALVGGHLWKMLCCGDQILHDVLEAMPPSCSKAELLAALAAFARRWALLYELFKLAKASRMLEHARTQRGHLPLQRVV